jgi:HSP20 family protein
MSGMIPYRRYDPLAAMRQRFNAMREMVDDLAEWRSPLAAESGEGVLSLDMSENDKEIIVKTTVPGVREEDINVTVTGDVLTISAEAKSDREERKDHWHIRELRYGRFSRSLRLTAEVNADKTQAELKDGVLTVTLPKVRPNPIKQIAVKAQKLLKSNNGK